MFERPETETPPPKWAVLLALATVIPIGAVWTIACAIGALVATPFIFLGAIITSLRRK